jgi:hypothetical protein
MRNEIRGDRNTMWIEKYCADDIGRPVKAHRILLGHFRP